MSQGRNLRHRRRTCTDFQGAGKKTTSTEETPDGEADNDDLGFRPDCILTVRRGHSWTAHVASYGRFGSGDTKTLIPNSNLFSSSAYPRTLARPRPANLHSNREFNSNDAATQGSHVSFTHHSLPARTNGSIISFIRFTLLLRCSS